MIKKMENVDLVNGPVTIAYTVLRHQFTSSSLGTNTALWMSHLYSFNIIYHY